MLSRPRLICLLLALVTLVAYLPVAQHGFVVYDDGDYLTENRFVQAGLTWSGVKWAFTTWHASNWHPLTWLSHMLDCELFGLDAGAHHLVNVLLHAANAVLLFVLLFRLTGALWPAAAVAALFAWHPLRVESVAWAAERKDVLSMLFGLLTLLAYVRYVQDKRRASFWLALILFALGLLAKPMLVTLPCVMLLLDWWPLQRFPEFKLPLKTMARLALEKWPFFLLTAVSCGVTFMAQRQSAVLSLEQHPLNLRFGNAVLSYAFYLLKAFWPVNLAVIYPLPQHLVWVQVAAAGGGLAIITWFIWHMRRAQPYLLIGWLWYLGTLVPVIGLVQVGQQAMADRYTYLPLIGIAIMAAYGIRELAARRLIKAGPLVCGTILILGGCLLAAERQLGYWKNDETLFAHAVEVTKDNVVAHINLGTTYEQQGRRAEALVQYQEAFRIAPDNVEANNNLANFLVEAGQTDEALAHYRIALRLRPDAPVAHINLGTLLVKLGQFDEGMSHYAEAVRLDPADPRPHYLMGKAELRRGQSVAALAYFHAALRQDADHYQTLTFLSQLLASDQDSHIRNGAEAVALAERANALTGGEQPFVLDTLAMAYAEAGRFDEAQQTIQKALDLATAAGAEELLPALQQRQRLYLVNQPFRETTANISSELQSTQPALHH